MTETKRPLKVFPSTSSGRRLCQILPVGYDHADRDPVRAHYDRLIKDCVDVGNVHAYFLGEHGDSEFPAWSMTHIAGISMDDYCPMCNRCNNWQRERQRIVKTVKESAYHIINYKGATYFAIGMALVRIAGTILQD
jgi:L-lactate dehydrogenase